MWNTSHTYVKLSICHGRLHVTCMDSFWLHQLPPTTQRCYVRSDSDPTKTGDFFGGGGCTLSLPSVACRPSCNPAAVQDSVDRKMIRSHRFVSRQPEYVLCCLWGWITCCYYGLAHFCIINLQSDWVMCKGHSTCKGRCVSMAFGCLPPSISPLCPFFPHDSSISD